MLLYVKALAAKKKSPYGKFRTAEEYANAQKLFQTFEISNVDKQRIIDASNNLKFNDFEDALQDSCAVYSDVDYIITRNVDDFMNSSVPILRPEEFINMIKEL